MATRLTGTAWPSAPPPISAPAAVNGGGTDHRTDLYAVGCLLYELLTGRPPYTGDSPFSVMHQHLAAEPVSPSRLRPELPPAMDALIARALHKDREGRFASASTMHQALGEASRPLTPAPPVRTPTTLDPAAFDPAALDRRAVREPAPAAVASPAPSGSGPEASPPARRRPARVVFRPTAEGAVALLGCFLSLVISRTDMIEVGQFNRVALLAALAGAVFLAVVGTARLRGGLGPGGGGGGHLGPSRPSAASAGRTHYVIIALVLGIVAALCLAAGYKEGRARADSLASWRSGSPP